MLQRLGRSLAIPFSTGSLRQAPCVVPATVSRDGKKARKRFHGQPLGWANTGRIVREETVWA